MPSSIDAEAKMDSARSMRSLILEHRDSIDTERRLPDVVLRGMAEMGMFRSMVPVSAGGEEWDRPTWVRVVEEMSTTDGAVGWIAGVGGSVNSITTGWLTDEVVREIIGSGQFGMLAGAGRPSGSARAVDGGFIVSGRWPFASACSHTGYFLGGYHIENVSGNGTMPLMFFPAADVEIIDTWHVGGMRGTGSHDFSVNEVFVPSERAINAMESFPPHDGPLYRVPIRLTLGAGLAPLSLGMARGAIDCFVELMESKPGGPEGMLMKDRPTVQERVAKAEALVRSARAYLYAAVDDMWEAITTNGKLDKPADS